MVFDYTDNDEYNEVAGCICVELVLSYRELANLHWEEDNTYIMKRIEIVHFYQCKILFRRVRFFFKIHVPYIIFLSYLFNLSYLVTYYVAELFLILCYYTPGKKGY